MRKHSQLPDAAALLGFWEGWRKPRQAQDAIRRISATGHHFGLNRRQQPLTSHASRPAAPQKPPEKRKRALILPIFRRQVTQHPHHVQSRGAQDRVQLPHRRAAIPTPTQPAPMHKFGEGRLHAGARLVQLRKRRRLRPRTIQSQLLVVLADAQRAAVFLARALAPARTRPARRPAKRITITRPFCFQ